MRSKHIAAQQYSGTDFNILMLFWVRLTGAEDAKELLRPAENWGSVGFGDREDLNRQLV